jgi:hypothetical protein
MEKFKGTPGKWILEAIKDSDGEISEIYILQETGGCIICVNNGDDVYDIPTDLANAKLIAAAPDLLEACQQLMECYESKGQLLSFDVDIIRQAINKALQP